MKKGFTLIEMLAVVVILAIVIGMAVSSSSRVKDNSLKKLLETKISDLESAAILYGQENQNLLTSCDVDVTELNPKPSFCTIITVDELIQKKYYKTTETNSNGEIDLINNVTHESMLKDKLTIYRKNNRIYALYIGS